jgi:hypothetical protein
VRTQARPIVQEVALRGRERLLEEERARVGLALCQQRDLLEARGGGGGGAGGGAATMMMRTSGEATEQRIRDAADARLLAALKEYVKGLGRRILGQGYYPAEGVQ